MDNNMEFGICTGYSDKEGEANIYKNGNVSVFDIVSTIYGGYRGGVYRNSVVLERDKLVEALNNFKGYKTNILQLKGDMAEFYHAGTFNINAAQRGSRHRVFVDRSHGLGSADISGNFDKDFGLKYYKDGGHTAKQQAKSIKEAYEKYKGNGGTDSIKEYLEKNGYKAVDENAPLYEGQIRIVPKEQLEDVKKWLERKIAEESLKRPEQVKRYQETLNMLDDRLRDGKNASLPLTNEEAKEIARIAKEGGIDSKILELTDEEIIRMKYVVT
ncbi:MAG: hypothetical protein K2O34_02285, partial [Acetatifactor sp.]|nr:hypothetical protein [Acetatifactor sp.]